MNSPRHKSEIALFEKLWKGGYFEGDPLDPLSPSGYGHFGYMSTLHATYLRCIKPYVNGTTQVLEIGPGRGAWTKCFVDRKARAVWALDALSAEHNGFWEYVGIAPNVRYCCVEDNLCAPVPDDSIDYFFSFGTFCHISPPNINDYFKSIYRKMRAGAVGFVMISDYAKFNRMLAQESKLSISRSFVGRRLFPIKLLWTLIFSVFKTHKVEKLSLSEDDEPRPGRWYNLGTDRAVAMLQHAGFKIVDPDVGVNHRDPIIHFEKPRP